MSKILKVVGASWMQTKISSYILGFLGVLAILALFVGQIERIQEDGNYAATVFYSEKTGYRIEYWGQSNDLKDIAKGVARAYFKEGIETTGWSLLEIETDGSYPDEIQAYAAGIVEGALTWYLIHTHLENTIRAKCEDQPLEKQCDKLRDALDKSVNIWKTYAADRAATDPFWHHVSLHYTQIGGIYTGWNHGVVRSNNEYETDISDLYWLNSVAEVVEIQHKLNISVEEPEFSTMPGLSSAFLRIANETFEGGKDIKKLFLAQSVAGSYSSMTRIIKRYKLNYHRTSKDTVSAPGASVEFAGYPGSITSQDEFYKVRGENHRLAITGTALRNYNEKLWKNVNITEQVPLGPRITAANHLASNVSSWGHIIASNNSGTGCKQWLVVDYNKFNQILHSGEVVSHKTEKKEIVTESMVNNDIKHTIVHRAGSGRAKGLLWLIEQVPGRTHSADISDAFLEKKYWATYGLPFFVDIANVTHVTKMEATYGKIFSESESPRAVIFQRGHKNATTMKSIIQLMRSNNLTAVNRSNDNDCIDGENCYIQKAEYWSALGYRGDIVQKHKRAYGIIDTKIIRGSTVDESLDFVAISSPPFTEPAKKNITKVNKGNVASIYTDQFDDVPMINGLEIRDLVKHQQEEAEKESLELLNKDVIQPFQWSESSFKEEAHEGLPDLWNFGPFRPHWSW
ncbi:putative phospholipase B-like lamina ancestor [Pararge aegeria]|uniref:Phospholipase B-like n=2 Tax=Pararge aegeria TaxID=116150 RepID=A0A8S4SJD4_9NEOP|nr:putative phospholipase B-like lamina ancestor [Pararge aegeria]XP_039752930.1 putative phospholipase B-like lamina ancestor [Pararge aegeria]XP_039752931.1 putative phospholipase B-like lamina ancestor [Pararge aegeria]CAH2269291.1 jg15067 [Pararge aegeria aegeria]